jgi:cytoskeletal protein CcmA (bactofilin family)
LSIFIIHFHNPGGQTGAMKKEKKMDRISTFIGADASFDGTVEFKGSIRVDGQLKGKIVSSGGTVVVGEKAVVEAEIQVNVAVVMGAVTGKIEAKERIEVYPPGRVNGDIQTPVILIEPGGVFIGSCAMKAAMASAGKVSVLSNQPAVDSDPNNKPLTAEPKKKTAFTELKNR